MLPHELLVKIFYSLEQRPQHRHSSTSSISFSSSLSLDRTDILACALVCQDWYYAAVDTLWRDVDLQSVESFIQLGMALDPTFSYMESPSRLCVYRRQQEVLDCRNGGGGGYVDEGLEEGVDECMDQVRRRQLLLPTNFDEGNSNSNSSGAINILRSRSATTAVATAKVATAGPETGSETTFSTSPSPMSNSKFSAASTSSSSSSSASSCYSLSSLGGPSLPDQIGYAGKGYIRTFSLAGTTDCQAPRPFPYLPSCITDRHLNAISPSLTHLTSISLSHCTALTDMAVIQLITLSSPYLKRIDLTECRLLTNLTVQVMASLCSELEELSLQGCGLVTDDAIEEVALHCTRLHRINIGQCQRAGDKSLEALLRASGRMTHLSSFSRVRTRNARLTKLGVAGCKGITYSGLSAITKQLNAAGTEQDGYLEPQRSSLVSLDFTCPAVKAPTAENVNGLSVSTVATTAASTRTQSQASRFFRTLPVTLEEISIHDAYTLSHSDIIALVDQVGPGLKVLRLDHANAINSETLGHVLAVCPNLTVLSIPRASRLDDSGVVQLIGARCAGSLVELDLSACHSLTDGCLTALAKCTLAASSRTSTLLENDKGKGIQEQPNPCLFPNLRRLDLSYNDKMTLAGIIPLVMSLKNLCALDVSFCGDGVTRSWSSTLESLRPILNPTSASSTMDSTGIDNLLGDAVIESDHSEDDESSSSSQQQYSPQQEQLLQFSPHMASSTGVQPPPQEYGLSSQNLQRFMNGVAPLVSPSRLGLGRYVGPLLNRGTSSNNITNTDDDIVPQHPQQYSRQGGTSLDRTPLGNRRRSSASSLTSSSSTSTIMSSSSSGSSSTSSSMTSDCSSSSSSSGSKRITHSRRRSCSRIHLADRLDVLENTPRRVGIAASFHLESWFTPQHQLQLQHLFQIQSQHQRDLQEIQAAAANQMLFNPQNAGTAANLFANSMPFEALSAEMMSHPVMTAIRVGAATVGGINNGGGPPAHGNGNGVGGGGGGGGGGRGVHGGPHGAGGNNATSHNLFDSHTNNNETTSPPAHHGSRRLSVTAGEGGGGVRHHHRHHYQHPHYHHRRNPLSSAATGHCEISAWGLIKLREEWAAVI